MVDADDYELQSLADAEHAEWCHQEDVEAKDAEIEQLKRRWQSLKADIAKAIEDGQFYDMELDNLLNRYGLMPDGGN